MLGQAFFGGVNSGKMAVWAFNCRTMGRRTLIHRWRFALRMGASVERGCNMEGFPVGLGEIKQGYES
jgi:hypothetical protein